MKPRHIMHSMLLISAIAWGPAVLWADPGLQPVDIVFEMLGAYDALPVTLLSPGLPVRWRNDTPTTHRIRHDGCTTNGVCAFQSVPLAPHDSFMIAPLAPGRYPYHCALHPIMRGVLIVLDREVAGAFSVAHPHKGIPAARPSNEG